MPNTTVAFNCPNCGADLAFNADKQKLCCEFCLSEFTEEEFESTDSIEKTKQKEEASAEFCEQMNEYACPNCGAEFASDEHTVAGICTYCHSPVVLKGKLNGQMMPDRIIPFKYCKEEAENKFFEFIKKYKFLPKDFMSKAHADKISGVYYPFWITDADTYARINGNATKVRVWRVGNTEFTETSRFNIQRAGQIHFEDIVSSALSTEDKEMLEGILPYPSEAIEPFSMPYISGFSAKKRDIEIKALAEEVRQRMQSYSETLLRNTVNGYATTTVNQKELKIQNSHWEYTLLPIWVLNYKTPKKTYHYAMNGYTGKIYGQLPLCMKKLIIASASVFASVAAVIGLIGGLIG